MHDRIFAVFNEMLFNLYYKFFKINAFLKNQRLEKLKILNLTFVKKSNIHIHMIKEF